MASSTITGLTEFTIEIQDWLKARGKMIDDSGIPKFADVPALLDDFFKVQDGDAVLKQFAAELKELEKQCLAATKAKDAVKKAALLQAVPAPPQPEAAGDGEAALQNHAVRLWQMGFSEERSLKGASNLCAILDVVKVNITSQKGNQTQKFPVEILFNLGQALPAAGSPIKDFSIGTANGFAVVLGSFLCCLVAIQKGWLKTDSSLSAPVRSELGKQLLKCLRLTTTYDPKVDVRQQVQSTLSTKIQASQRSRPTTLQMLYTFERVVVAELAGGTRKPRAVLLKETLEEYNRKETVRNYRIYSDEIDGIKFLSDRSVEFKKVLKIIWGAEKPSNTALPMSLLASDWLQDSAPLPVHAAQGRAWRVQLLSYVVVPCSHQQLHQ